MRAVSVNRVSVVKGPSANVRSWRTAAACGCVSSGGKLGFIISSVLLRAGL